MAGGWTRPTTAGDSIRCGVSKVIMDTDFDALREVSPMLASRNSLSTAEDSMADVATKLADLVAL